MKKSMALSDAEKAAMIRVTHEAALAMVDDLQHMREIIAKPEPTPGDIRRMSSQLRRILIDNGGDICKIAPPRIGPLRLTAPDTLPLEKAARKEPWVFLSAGVAEFFGFGFGAWAVNEGERPLAEDYQPDGTVSLRIDRFLAQKVICFQGRWISRADVIKYIANVAHGVHSGSPKEESHEVLRKIRHVFTIKLAHDGPEVSFDQSAIRYGDKPINVDRDALDFVLIQLISAAHYLTVSPDVTALENIIQKEDLPL
jgi:hypothetical protein